MLVPATVKEMSLAPPGLFVPWKVWAPKQRGIMSSANTCATTNERISLIIGCRAEGDGYGGACSVGLGFLLVGLFARELESQARVAAASGSPFARSPCANPYSA